MIVGDVTWLNALSDCFSASDNCSFAGKLVALLPRAFHSPKLTAATLFLSGVSFLDSSLTLAITAS